MKFIDESGSFELQQPDHYQYLYFPLASEHGLKSAVTPNLGGDAKLSQEYFLLEPVSAENLHNNRSTRNFWLRRSDGTYASVTGASARQEAARFTAAEDPAVLRAGLMWHTLTRTLTDLSVQAEITSFVPVSDNVELMCISLTNTAAHAQTFTPYAAIPLYGRSADNIRDHRNVTSMLHRIKTTEHGVQVCPTMSFDERGHRTNKRIYYVYGYGADQKAPLGFFPTVEEFLGEGGTYTAPRAVLAGNDGDAAGCTREGREAIGAFRFPELTLESGATQTYILMLGTENSELEIQETFARYDTQEKVHTALEETVSYWKEKTNVAFRSGDSDLDALMKWICFQPFLRRIYGCSFLPHHDYGRGGRGWRDLWQDCLSLLLMEPDQVGHMIHQNFGGVRIDGTNATIIGDGNGNFIADRNGIARVWMDHALWPLMTTKLYIDQTGDVALLNREATYFKDAQSCRGTEIDESWKEDDGNQQKTTRREIYRGSILEHLLIQQLTAFYEVGDHNVCRLRGADWNDALDMAAENGESVAFTYAYAGNLRTLAALIRLLDQTATTHETELLKPVQTLLAGGEEIYANRLAKKAILAEYLHQTAGTITAEHITVSYEELAQNLEEKADFLFSFLGEQEWISAPDDEGWFNSYYDNHGRRVEGVFESGVRMMLTGQVFAIMSGVASEEQIAQITRSADHYLYRKEIGGYRLNTNFHELKFDMGRMFGFAYGEKENGAVFSHMTVMYANALYKRGFVREGWKALKTLADASLHFDTSKIYPGIPEYFRADGRGMYHYLTGAASWFMMTMITDVYGVRGEAGDLCLQPKLLCEQFSAEGIASVDLTFAGKELTVIYTNPEGKEYGDYRIASVTCNGEACEMTLSDDGTSAIIPRSFLATLPEGRSEIAVILR